MLEVKYADYDEQDSPFYVPPKPRDYYTNTGIYEKSSSKSSNSYECTSYIHEFVGAFVPDISKKENTSNYNTCSSPLEDFLRVFTKNKK